MTAEAFDDVLGALLDRRPFQIFTVELNGGEKIEIDHPRAISYREGFAHFTAPGGKLYWFDHTSVNKLMDGRVETPQT